MTGTGSDTAPVTSDRGRQYQCISNQWQAAVERGPVPEREPVIGSGGDRERASDREIDSDTKREPVPERQ